MPTAITFLATFLLTLSLNYASPLSEIQALLSFKQNLHDPINALSNWNTSTPQAPCDWFGIVCNENNLVHQLNLPRVQLSGTLTNELSNLKQLRRLNLHNNNLNGSIPKALSECVLLRAVYLQYNSFTGGVPYEIFLLKNLQVLSVSHNLLNDQLPRFVPESLRYLDLSSNSLRGGVPNNLSSLSQLQYVNLSFNRFSGTIPGSIGVLQRLQYVWLDRNQLVGTIPSALSNCKSLINFSAGDNMLQGQLPATLGSLTKLQRLSLSRNQLSGVVPISLFCSPIILELGLNAFTGVEIPDLNRPNSSCKSVLEVLDIHGNQIKNAFPSWLMNVSTLKALDVSGNFLTGALPVDIGNLVNLEELRVANNSLTGEIPEGIVKCGLLRVLDLAGNRLSGPIPEFLGDLKSLDVLSLGRNLFNGGVPESFAELSNLDVLDLSNNDLNGVVPLEIMNLTNLTTLDLSNNRLSGGVLTNVGGLNGLVELNLSGCGFSGTIPSSIGGLLRLTILDLSKQNLSGELPFEIFGLPNLQVVALQENNLSGDVPEGFSSLSSLQSLNLSSNKFSGEVPSTYGFLGSLIFLSLSDNAISGLIPEELGNSSALEVLELRHNQLSGHIPDGFSHLPKLKKLDLSRNNLTGDIPTDISKCASLDIMLLDSNNFSGSIPDSLAKLLNLTILDLSSNNFTGKIPDKLSNIPELTHLNFSHNHLEGEIPGSLGSRFSDPSVYANNDKLCGKPLKRECGNVRRRKRRRLILFIVVLIAGCCILALCCCGYVYSLFRWRKKLRAWAGGEKKTSPGRISPGAEGGRGSGENGGPKLVMFNNKITYAETVEATRQFDEENVLSRGKYGVLFKSIYQDGMVLAIRRLLDTSSIDESTFRKEAESLGKVKHRNLTVLRGYYAGPPPDVRLLVYDYMPNGNLATLLQEASHQDGHVLNWPMRHLIALGIARGLAFLHLSTIWHGDIKPQNVLFDADFEAHISEFGLEKLSVPAPAEASTSTTPVGTLGYVAPEVTLTGQPTKEADVYSFGIVLLEILTGRKPVMFTQDEDIVKWVKRQLQSGQIAELLEPGLLELDPESSEWEEYLLGIKVGLLCTMPDPSERPSMTDVIFMLEGCRVGTDIPSSADPTTLHSPM